MATNYHPTAQVSERQGEAAPTGPVGWMRVHRPAGRAHPLDRLGLTSQRPQHKDVPGNQVADSWDFTDENYKRVRAWLSVGQLVQSIHRLAGRQY